MTRNRLPHAMLTYPGRYLALAGLLWLTSGAALGGVIETKRDFARLPAYCAVRLHSHDSDPAFKRWEALIGPNFIHIHHYCFGLHKRIQARKLADNSERRSLMLSAIKELDYVESHSAGPLSLFPEIFTERGRMWLELGEVANASRDFARALQADPKYGRAYGALADLYLSQDKRDQAMRILEQGLVADPDSRGLKKRLARLKARPAPAKAKPVDPATPPADTAPAAQAAAPDAGGKAADPADAAARDTDRAP